MSSFFRFYHPCREQTQGYLYAESEHSLVRRVFSLPLLKGKSSPWARGAFAVFLQINPNAFVPDHHFGEAPVEVLGFFIGGDQADQGIHTALFQL